MRGVHLAEIDADIELLTGLNVPRALEPIKVIPSSKWKALRYSDVVGMDCQRTMSGEADLEQPNITVNCISVMKLDELWKQSLEEQPSPSKEDCHSISYMAVFQPL